MRIARYVIDDEPRFGLVELAEDAGEYPETVADLVGDPMVSPARYSGKRHDLAAVRLVAPVIPRSKVIGFGDTYAATPEAAVERRAETGNYPLFLKPNTSVVGPGEPIILPTEAQNVWFEGELALVIGKMCRRVPVELAEKVIFGYTIANDVTAKDLQQPGFPWASSKGADTFCPLGPWIVAHWTTAEAREASLRSWVNDEPRQDASLAQLVPSLAELVARASQFTTLLPGDVLLTGAAPGPGPIIAGDRVRIEISGLGELENPVFAEEA